MILLLIKIILIGANHILTLADFRANRSVDCIIEAVQLLAKHKIVLEFTNETKDIASEILNSVNTPVLLNAVEHRQLTDLETRPSVDVYVLLKDKKPAKILNDILWNGKTRFILLADAENTIQEYFDLFWKKKVINVFAMSLSEGNILYSFLPYGKKNCSKAELIVADTCVSGKLQNGGIALKDSMRIKNMNQCPINITVSRLRPALIIEPNDGGKYVSKVEGFEGKLMVEVARVFNYNATFKTAEDGTRWGWVLPEPRGAIGDVFRGISDMTVGMLSAFMDRYEYLDCSANYNFDDCITFVVPQGYASKRVVWLTNFVTEFSYYTWLLILLSFVMIVITTWFIKRYLKESWLKTKIEIPLYLYSICIGVPIKSPKYLASRVSFIFWIIFGVIITVGYTASMGSMLAVPPRDYDIDDLVQLLESDLQIKGARSMIQAMNYTDYPFPDLMKRYRFSNDSMDVVVERIVNGEKIATLYSELAFLYQEILNPKAIGRIHVVEQCVNIFRPHVFLQKFSPFTNRVSQIVRRLDEGGIMEMWRGQYMTGVHTIKKPFFKLSMKQLFGAFCFLFVGHSVALISFLYEVYTIFGFRKPLSGFLIWFKKSLNTYRWAV